MPILSRSKPNRSLPGLTRGGVSASSPSRPILSERPGTPETSGGRAGVPASAHPDSRLHIQIRARLLALSYRAFLQTVVHLLSAQGYTRVAPVGRSSFKGRNRAGGWDLEAHDYIDGEHFRCIVQVKQFASQAIYQRHVDELRGGLLRAGANEALLITLAALSPQARLAALAGGVRAPVRLTDGEELAAQMLEHRIGVCQVRGKWVVNALYFESLEKRFAEKRLAEEENGGNDQDEKAEAEVRVRPWKTAASAPKNLVMGDAPARRAKGAASWGAFAAPPPGAKGTATRNDCDKMPALIVRLTVTVMPITVIRGGEPGGNRDGKGGGTSLIGGR